MEGIELRVIFFLIPILVIALIPTAYADVEKGKNFDKEIISINPDGTRTIQHKILSYDRTEHNGSWVDYVYTNHGTYLEVKTAYNKVILDAATCGFSFYNANNVLLFQDSIIAFNSIVNQYTWNAVTSVNNATCEAYFDNGSLVAKKHAAGVGFMEYKYIFDNGKWKTQLEATNLTGLTNRVFGFDQTINLNRDTINFGGQQRNLDNFDGQTFNRTWLENNEAKVIDFLNDFNFDFDIGFEYLDSITIIDNGANASKLVFHYMRNNEILMPNETLVIDPSVTYNFQDGYRVYSDQSVGATCSTVGNTKDTTVQVYRATAAANDRCYIGGYEFNISTLPDNSVVTSIVFESNIAAITGSMPLGCDIVKIPTFDLSTLSAAQMYTDVTGGTSYLSNTPQCTVVGTNKQTTDIGSTAHADLQAHLTTDDLFSIGLRVNDYNSRGATLYSAQFSVAELIVTYYENTVYAVDDLMSPSQSYGSVDLLWTTPYSNPGNVTGYQINYTTPWGSPLTEITSNTTSTDTSITISGLSVGTDYSFRISGWSGGVNNATGNILNVTTAGNFTIGSASFNQTNTAVLPITFEEQSINSTATFLNVTYANTYTLACDFYYQFANTNRTYTGLTGYAVSSTLDETYFILTDFENEIINVECYDTVSGTDANYLMTQSDFPLLQQIANFRNGTYGTMGLFGVFDLVTIAVVIFSMIGLNRVNESVGAIFNIILLGSLAYFEIIELPTVIFGALTVVIIFVITSTKKD